MVTSRVDSEISRLGMESTSNQGGTMEISYYPYIRSITDMLRFIRARNGQAIFWRIPGVMRYFYWTSNDGSKVLTANILDSM